MFTFYKIQNNSLQPVSTDEAKEGGLIWIDLIDPTYEEELFVEELLNVDIPTRAEMREIELSSRLYNENGALYSTATIVVKVDASDPETQTITFVLVDKCLITIRYCEPQAIRSYLNRLPKLNVTNYKGSIVFIDILESIVNRLADVLELVAHNIDGMTKILLEPRKKKNRKTKEKPTDFADILRQNAVQGDLISKTRESLISLNRLFSFIYQSSQFSQGTDEHARLQTLLRDIPALADHASFLSSKITFILEATLGLISTEQNNIIKIFSVAAVMFLPPTLVASVYGMNFEFMPELHWAHGYPFALVLMFVSAVLPYLFFRRQGWL